ncbi:MAG TPA: pyridoxal phosphate-dependent aminotransferase [Thermoanaerobaculia bacterium]|nr:pyridoxal phosphate-dependent aminotransferase [Thermoanaerobaculia bacterium]
MFSKRAHWTAAVNELTLARRGRTGVLDLTGTNPTRAALPYPIEALSDALARGARASYDADPRGLLSARETLAAHLHCDPDDLLLTASTSEAYSYLFKLLTDPGDVLLTATPSYPLLEHLAQMEHITLQTFAMEFQRRWEIHDVPVDARTRAILVVNPNNPTGSFVSQAEQDALARHRLPIVSDEVFLDYPLEGRGTTFVRDDVLTFTLGGLSKSAGLPHFKLGWIRVSGPGKREALDALEMIADNYLSVATPVQVALPELLSLGATIRNAISARTRHNLATLRAIDNPRIDVLPVEGGWSAVLRVPRVRTDDELALHLLAQGVFVQPGYFFDFERDGYIVVSLLTEEETFEKGVALIAANA